MIQQKEKNQLQNWELVSVNPNDKNWNWKDLFCFWGNSIQSVIGFSLIASLYLVYDLNILIVLAGCLISGFLVCFFSNLIGNPSQKHGLPFPVILRMSMGINGARYVALFRGLVGIFMFGVQTFFISKSIGYLIRIFIFEIDKNILDNEIFLSFFMGLNLIDGIAFILTLILQFFLFSKGQTGIRSFINFSAYFVYFGLVLFLIIILSENFNELIGSVKYSLNLDNTLARKNIAPLISIIGTMFAYFSIIIINFGDFSRYVKDKQQMSIGNYSLILNIVLFSVFSVMIVLGADIILAKNLIEVDNLLTNPNDIIGKFSNNYLTVISIMFIMFATASTNLIANYVPSQNVLLNFMPKSLNLKNSGFIIILLGFLTGLFWLPVLSQIGMLSIIDTIGSMFGPLAGIMVADYYLIKKKNVNYKDIYSSLSQGIYYFSGGWQIKGLYALIIGFVFAASTMWNPNFMHLQSFAWLIGFVVSWFTYYLLASD